MSILGWLFWFALILVLFFFCGFFFGGGWVGYFCLLVCCTEQALVLSEKHLSFPKAPVRVKGLWTGWRDLLFCKLFCTLAQIF